MQWYRTFLCINNAHAFSHFFLLCWALTPLCRHFVTEKLKGTPLSLILSKDLCTSFLNGQVSSHFGGITETDSLSVGRIEQLV